MFETDRLRAVRLVSDHLAAIRVFHQDERMMALIGGTREPAWSAEYLAAHEANWNRDGIGFWLLHDRSNDTAIGLGGLRTMQLDGTIELEVGYAFLPEHWGRGLATEITVAFLDLAPQLPDFSSVVAVIDPRNDGSIRVVEKLGFAMDRTVQHEMGARLIYRREHL